MASIKGTKFFAPKFMTGDGCATAYVDTIDLVVLGITALAVGDTLEFAVPAGAEVHTIDYDTDQIDSSTGLVFKAGYKSQAVQDAQLTANDTYFGSGLTLGRAKARGTLQFKPLRFDEPVSVFLTVTAVPTTYVAGKLALVIGANCVGIK
jgi:hypothetical protein